MGLIPIAGTSLTKEKEGIMSKDRTVVNTNEVERGVGELESTWLKRLDERGYGIFISDHETLGIVTEEYHELIQAVKNNDLENIREELMDIAVACMHGVASIDKK